MKHLYFPLFLLLSTPILAEEFSGNFKSSLTPVRSPVRSSSKDLSQIYWDNSIRAQHLTQLDQNSGVELAYNLSLQYFNINHQASSSAVRSKSYRLADLSDSISTHKIDNRSTEGIRLSQNLDRVAFRYYAESFDLQVGRVPIGFGSARVVNPTDVIVPQAISAIDSEDRYGVDALRFRRAFGEMGELDLGVVGGEHFKQKESALFVNFRQPIGQWYLTSTVIRFKENFLAGMDWQGELAGVGIWLEYGYNLMEDSKDYSRLSFGGEYTVNQDLIVFSEYHHNGAGAESENSYLLNSQSKAYTQGGVSLLARDYIIPGFSYQLSPLIASSASVILNLNDLSALISPRLEYNLKENLYIDFGLIVGVGEKVSDEFGIYSDLLYTMLRYYF